MVAVVILSFSLFSYKRAEGKVVFFHFVQGVRVQKSLMPRRSAAQGFVVYYDIFFSSFPLLSPIRTLSGSVILRINGSGRGQAQSLFILYDDLLVCRIYSGLHYKFATTYIRIICTILFYQDFLGQ